MGTWLSLMLSGQAALTLGVLPALVLGMCAPCPVPQGCPRLVLTDHWPGVLRSSRWGQGHGKVVEHRRAEQEAGQCPLARASGCFNDDLKLLLGESSQEAEGMEPGTRLCPGTAPQFPLMAKAQGWETQGQGCTPGRPHPAGTVASLPSPPAWSRAEL